MEVSNLKPFDNDKTKVSLKDKLKFIIPSSNWCFIVYNSNKT